jgi:hypothetical protein
VNEYRISWRRLLDVSIISRLKEARNLVDVHYRNHAVTRQFEGLLCIESFSIYNDAVEPKETIKLLTDY